MKPIQNFTKFFYESNHIKYFNETINIDVSELYASFLKNLNIDKSISILDLGCGSCRDSIFFHKKKYNVFSADFSFNLLRISKTKFSYLKVINLNFFNLPFKKYIFNGIFANASLLHIKKKDIISTLNNLCLLLKKQGIFYFSLKLGEGEGFDQNKRFFSYYTPEEIKEIVETTNLKIIEISISDSKDSRKIKWINVLTQKNNF